MSVDHSPEKKMKYLHWDEKTIVDFSPEHVSTMYERGYVFTRKGRGIMHQTRSVRIDLSKFELSSENRRILKKMESVTGPKEHNLPYQDYSWEIAKIAKDFYEKKFGVGIMSANKIKELITDTSKSNFNTLLTYHDVGYCVAYRNDTLLHYCYPFYDLETTPKDMGLGMMILAIVHAKEQKISHIYIGSLQRPSDTYKLQFSGLEWFDGGPAGSNQWNTDIQAAKKILL